MSEGGLWISLVSLGFPIPVILYKYYQFLRVSYCSTCRARSQNIKVPETPRREKTEIISG